MDQILTIPQRINFYNCDRNRDLSLRSYLEWCGEMGNLHLEQIGLTWERMQTERQAFLLSRVGYHRLAPVQYGEQCRFHTWIGGIKGPLFLRNFSLEKADGSTAIESTSGWMLVDPVERKILRPSQFKHEHPAYDRPVDAQLIRFRLSELPELGRHTVLPSQIDTNGHMGNQFYADLLANYAPDGLGIRVIDRAQLVFDHEAIEGEEITLYGQRTDACSYEMYGVLPSGRKCFEAQVTVAPAE
ncbi:MAG: hypothetical protein IJD21_04170 [Oscillospiraceae bacterium]|nr:hypothetical protein [Oscillospiraceae bacterium]